MVQFKAFEKGFEVSGESIMSVVAGLGAFKSIAMKLFKEAGFGEIITDGKHWYPLQPWLDTFKKISEQMGESVLFTIGMKIPENAVFPKEMDSVEKALASIDVAYHMNHRNAKGQVLFDPSKPGGLMLEGIGHYRIEKIAGENKIIVTCHNPYPCDFDRGIITAMARKFAPNVTVQHEREANCRKKGAEACAYSVVW